jgi:DNA-binding response OmpR family regulator
MRVDVAVINSSEELAELLEFVLQEADMTTTQGFTIDFKRGRQDLSAFFEAHDPQVVVWDVAIPYEENWEYAQAMQALPAALGRTFILTTTNERALRQLTGEAAACEIIGKPFDLDHLTQQVRSALEAATARWTRLTWRPM